MARLTEYFGACRGGRLRVPLMRRSARYALSYSSPHPRSDFVRRSDSTGARRAGCFDGFESRQQYANR